MKDGKKKNPMVELQGLEIRIEMTECQPEEQVNLSFNQLCTEIAQFLVDKGLNGFLLTKSETHLCGTD